MKRVLLISNSTLHGSGYLDHCAEELRRFLGPGVARIAFVPYALHDRAGYAAKVRARLERLGLAVDSLHDATDPRAAIARAEAVFVGGGNTFRLLDELYTQRLLDPIRERVAAGMPYVGSSAGSNVACASIQTTNDMPIVYPPSFDALRLVPFNLNPHYLDPDPNSKHMGETREQRIAEFHEECPRPVLGLREGAMLRVEGETATLLGTTGARLFSRGRLPREFVPPARLDELLVPID
ncbi:MAG: dipeptidase PepE [Planctomycetes bacterium]|nr:dipeptidase PepE [Planctomycetota bacterium]